jgi:hypothetical protein
MSRDIGEHCATPQASVARRQRFSAIHADTRLLTQRSNIHGPTFACADSGASGVKPLEIVALIMLGSFCLLFATEFDRPRD